MASDDGRPNPGFCLLAPLPEEPLQRFHRIRPRVALGVRRSGRGRRAGGFRSARRFGELEPTLPVPRGVLATTLCHGVLPSLGTYFSTNLTASAIQRGEEIMPPATAPPPDC